MSDMKKISVALRIACALCNPSSKIAQFGTSGERFKLAQLIIKKAIDASSFKAIGPLVAQQFVVGALGEFTIDQIRGKERKMALRALQVSSFSLSLAEAGSVLGDLEKAAETTLEIIYRTKARSWGLDALEEAYTKLVTEGAMFKAGKSSASETVSKMKINLQNLLSTVITNAMTDSFRVNKRRRDIEEGLGREVDEDNMDFDGGVVDEESGVLLSRTVPEKMRKALIELVEGDTASRLIASRAINILKVNSLAAARIFVNTAKECNALPSGGKFSSDFRGDLVALALCMPFVDSKLSKGTRQETIEGVFEYIKRDYGREKIEQAIFGPAAVTKAMIETHFARMGLRASAAQEVADYISKMDVSAIESSISNWIDQTYIELVRLMMRVDLNLGTGRSEACVKALAAISDRAELKKIERALGVPRSTTLFSR